MAGAELACPVLVTLLRRKAEVAAGEAREYALNKLIGSFKKGKVLKMQRGFNEAKYSI